MNGARFALKLAWRETRASWRRLGVYMASISLGVAALVAINSFRANVLDTIRAESRALLGADLRLESRTPFSPAVRAVLDSMAAENVPVGYVTSTASMALAASSQQTRLFQLRAVTGHYPQYGQPATDPPGLWEALDDRRIALADPALLVQLDTHVGDTIQIGAARFELAGTVSGLPSDVGLQTAIGPRIFIGGSFLDDTELIRFGSLVEYQAYLRLPEPRLERFLDRHDSTFRAERVRTETPDRRARSLIRAYGAFGDFLGLVGLTALLLGGIGVASAIHVFMKEKLTGVAVLRCLGASQRSVFGAYLLQAGLLGLAGAAAGALVGVAVQAALPRMLAEILPVRVAFSLQPMVLLSGLAIGVWVATMFSLLPLLTIRDVAPLQALRRDVEPVGRRYEPVRIAAGIALAASVFLLSRWQAPDDEAGLAFALGLGATTVCLWLTALLLVRLTRRFLPRSAPYVVRQGIANLFRPRNQTVVVTLAVGFGVFLLATMYLVQRNLLVRLDLGGENDWPSILLFDVQPDQRPGIDSILEARGLPPLDVTPIVPARLSHINGRSVEELLQSDGASRWALRREYRHTYRDTLASTETLVAGAWWPDRGQAPDGGVASDSARAGSPRAGPALISMEVGLAESLGVGIGDHLTWEFQGVPIESRIASLRSVDWATLAPNFYVVFEPGVLERAPQTLVALGRIDDPQVRAELQRDLVAANPNISALDLTVVQEAVDAIAGRIAIGIRVLAAFTIAGGVFVLVGSLATSRYQRRRESALLKTLGASRRQIVKILLTEYLALGSLAALTGIALATVAASLLVVHLFEIPFALPLAPLAGIWLGVAALTLLVGFANSRDVLERTPLAVLQETAS